MQIFDRWGGLLYAAEGPDASWGGLSMGVPAQPGVYAYLIEYTDLQSGERKIASGDVALVR